MQPALFLSHGSPMLALQDIPARTFLEGLGANLERPDAILVISAHWETAVPTVNSVAINDTIHDFRGFPQALFEMTYPVPGAPALAGQIVELLVTAGLQARTDFSRGLDHGAWIPLSLMWPTHDIPVLQLSVQSKLGPGHHLQVGRALHALRAQNVLILASGSFTHNLRATQRHGAAPEPDWVTRFAHWMNDAIVNGRVAELVRYRCLAPFAVENHPTDEHLLPLFVAVGAAGEHPAVERIHQSTDLGTLRMDAYRFD